MSLVLARYTRVPFVYTSTSCPALCLRLFPAAFWCSCFDVLPASCRLSHSSKPQLMSYKESFLRSIWGEMAVGNVLVPKGHFSFIENMLYSHLMMLIVAIYPYWVCLGNGISFVFLFLWCPHMYITQLAPFAYRRRQSDWCHRCDQASRQQDETEYVCEVLLQPSAAQSPQRHQSGVFRHQVSIVWKWCWTQRCFFWLAADDYLNILYSGCQSWWWFLILLRRCLGWRTTGLMTLTFPSPLCRSTA